MPEWPKPLSMTMMMMMNNMYLRKPDEYPVRAKKRRHVHGTMGEEIVEQEGMRSKGEEKSCSSFAALAAVIFHISPAI